MSVSEFVSGQERLEIFNQLEREGIILNAHLMGTGLKQLTVIKRLTSKKDEWFFLMACPACFKARISDLDDWDLGFAFIGEQGIPYRFFTSGGSMVGENDILIRIPETIERIIRRKHFRIKAHPAAVLRARADAQEIEMRVIDISQGGALVMFTADQQLRMLSSGQQLLDLRIMLLPGEKEAEALRVNRAEVRSVALEPQSGTYHFGLMFVDLTSREEKAIKNRIYVDQRQMLRKKTV